MGRIDEYRAQLRGLDTARWPAFLDERSGLPGPRGNIELGQAVAAEGDPEFFDRLIADGGEYRVFCGVLGLGSILATGADPAVEQRLHAHASDPRWRVREGVAMALQRVGDDDPDRLAAIVRAWAADPDPLVQRAAAAGICEPRLLRAPEGAACALDVCERVTRSLEARPVGERRDPAVRTLRQALGYCWSVAVAADPVRGLARFRALEASPDRDVAWIVRENLRKKRLAALVPTVSRRR